MKKLLLSLAFLAFAGNVATAVPNNGNNGNSGNNSFVVSGTGFVGGVSTTDAVNPSGISDVSDGNGGFLTNGFNNYGGSTDVVLDMVNGHSTFTVNNVAEGVSYGYNAGGEDLTSSLLLGSGFVHGNHLDFGSVAGGVATGQVLQGTGVTQAYVVGSIHESFVAGNLNQSLNVHSFGLATASGHGAASAFSTANVTAVQYH